MIKLHYKYFQLLLFVAVFLSACSPTNKPKFTDTPTSGDILILCDEAYQPIIQVEVDTFMHLYNRAKIRVKYLPETLVFNELLNNDSVRIAITGRKLLPHENDVFTNRKLIPIHTKIAYDAVALICNKKNSIERLLHNQVAEIINGSTTNWNQLKSTMAKDSIVLVYDRTGSINFRFLTERFLSNQNKLPNNAYALNGNLEVIDYISKHQNAIGVISINWLSDLDSDSVKAKKENIQVISISEEGVDSSMADYFTPQQAFIATKKYPFIREVFTISREGRSGLGTGFASFLAGDTGQRLIRLMGLLPATVPIRIVNVHS
ncbi:MAG: hypothetical protein RIQ89_2395 [Bacteroidota bacterium]